MFHFHNFSLNLRWKRSNESHKKVASGLVSDAEKSWFSELSDKGNHLLDTF